MTTPLNVNLCEKWKLHNEPPAKVHPYILKVRPDRFLAFMKMNNNISFFKGFLVAMRMVGCYFNFVFEHYAKFNTFIQAIFPINKYLENSELKDTFCEKE